MLSTPSLTAARPVGTPAFKSKSPRFAGEDPLQEMQAQARKVNIENLLAKIRRQKGPYVELLQVLDTLYTPEKAATDAQRRQQYLTELENKPWYKRKPPKPLSGINERDLESAFPAATLRSHDPETLIRQMNMWARDNNLEFLVHDDGFNASFQSFYYLTEFGRAMLQALTT